MNIEKNNICKIIGCNKKIHYKNKGICQMHYFRNMRTGSFNIIKKPRSVRTHNSAGYQMLLIENHPLSMKNGFTYEHRAIVYEIYGNNLPDCKLCGKNLNWKIVHIDHIDENVKNNEPSNLRPLCNACNTKRNKKPAYMKKGTIALTYEGETKTINEWARDPRVNVSRGAIKRRKESGMNTYDCLFMPKLTHNGKKAIKKPTPPKYTRKNSIAIEWEGEKKTASEWARDNRVSVSDSTIRNRIRSGMDIKQTLFSPPYIGGIRK